MYDPIVEFNNNQKEQYDPFKALAKRLCEYDFLYAFLTPPKCYIKNCIKTCPGCFDCTEKKFQIIKKKFQVEEEFLKEFYDFAGVSNWFEPIRKAYSFNSLKEFYDFYKEKNITIEKQLKRNLQALGNEEKDKLKQHETVVLFLRNKIKNKEILRLPKFFSFVLKNKNKKILAKSKDIRNFHRFINVSDINSFFLDCLNEPNKKRDYYIDLEHNKAQGE